MEIIIIIFSIILLSFLLSKLFEYINIPKIMAPLLIGIFYSFLYTNQINNHQEVFRLLSELGIIMLLFYTGLELDIKGLRKQGKETFIIAILGAILSFGLGFFVSWFLLNLSLIVSFVISATLSITAQGVMAILLDETKMIKSKVGEIILGAGIIDDIIGMILLFIISFIISSKDFTLSTLKPFFYGLIFVFLFFYFFDIIKKLLGNLFLKENKDNFYDVFSLALILVFLIAGFTKLIGFDFSIGAILAGIILNISLTSKGREGIKEEHLIDKFVKAISFGFLNYFFFFWVGFNIDLITLINNPLLGILLCLVGFSGKFIASMIGIYFNKDTYKNGLLIGLGMTTKGGVGLIIAQIANNTGIISVEIFSSIVFMVIILTIIPPIVFNILIKYEKN